MNAEWREQKTLRERERERERERSQTANASDASDASDASAGEFKGEKVRHQVTIRRVQGELELQLELRAAQSTCT